MIADPNTEVGKTIERKLIMNEDEGKKSYRWKSFDIAEMKMSRRKNMRSNKT